MKSNFLTIVAAGVWAAVGSIMVAAAADKPTDKPLAASLDRLLESLDSADKAIPRDSFEPQAIVAKVGKDPVKLCDWVRDNTCWVAYRGVLRGPVGVLMDCKGNSLDRSLLLAELLRLSGKKVRLAHTDLDERAGAALLEKVSEVEPPAPEAKAPVKPQTDEASQALEAKQAELAKEDQEATARITEQTAWLKKLVGKLEGGTTDVQPLSAIRDHWWVQCQDANQWIDLDPLAAPLPDKPAETVTPDARGLLPEANPNWQQVQLRVIIEQWDKGKLQESKALGYTLRPAALIGQPVFLSHNPLKLDKNDADKTRMDDANQRKLLLAQIEWAPVLTVGNKSYLKSGFSAAGDLIANPHPQAEPGMINPGGMLGGFGLGGGDEEDPPPAKETVLTAEWLEYEFQAPGSKPWTIRRPVFDLLGPSARAKGAASFSLTDVGRLQRAGVLSGQVDILCLPCQVSGQFTLHYALKTLIDGLRPLQAMCKQGKAKPDTAGRAFLQTVTGMQFPLFRWARLRQDWAVNEQPPLIASPNMVNLHQFLVDGPDGKLAPRAILDIVSNDVGCPGSGSPPDVRLAQGVIDAVAEAHSLGPWAADESVCRLTDVAAKEQVEWAVVRKPEDLNAGFSPDVRVRVGQALAQDELVVIPNQPVELGGRPRIGWWSIDPRTGRTITVLDDGFHPAEYSITNRVPAVMINWVTVWGVRISATITTFEQFVEKRGLDLSKMNSSQVMQVVRDFNLFYSEMRSFIPWN